VQGFAVFGNARGTKLTAGLLHHGARHRAFRQVPVNVPDTFVAIPMNTAPPLHRTHRTADGSHTLLHAAMDEPYHSLHGAVQESTHVFIKAGLEAVCEEVASGKPHVRVLEVGLGTGLNLLLTWIRCLEGKCTVDYTALEPHPVAESGLEALRHADELAWPGLHEPFITLMGTPEGTAHEAEGGLRFTRLSTPVQEFAGEGRFDVVYFDAFAPRRHAYMWTDPVFQRLYKALLPGGMLVTYCAKGDVRRTLLSVGFHVERLPGPPGKKHMLRATKPDP